jgi:hypothetical protein
VVVPEIDPWLPLCANAVAASMMATLNVRNNLDICFSWKAMGYVGLKESMGGKIVELRIFD